MANPQHAILTNLEKYQWYTHMSRTEGADLGVIKEAIKAAYTAAQAAADAAWAEAVIDDASADIDDAGATGNETVNADSLGPARPSLQLGELRPGAPESAGTRILFTVEPPGTAVLLAAGMESDWLRAWYTEAIANCRIRYQREQGSKR